MIESGAQALIEEISGEFAKLPEVTAVVLSGSKGSEFPDDGSDLDLYVYAEHESSKAWRADLARKFGERASIGGAALFRTAAPCRHRQESSYPAQHTIF